PLFESPYSNVWTMWGSSNWIAISPSDGRGSWVDARAAAASFLSRNWTFRQTFLPVSLSTARYTRDMLPREVSEMIVNRRRRFTRDRRTLPWLDSPGANISFSLL